ncbi:MAG: hypothetical protein Q7R35_15610 [Elusimicrobiota bacterium]|nr:hypothetical protein [Elusimicrobiota bacterium]
MNENKDGEFSEFPGLAERLRRADFAGESRVRDVLKERLLAKAEKRGRRSPFIWLVPAAALAAVLIMFAVRHEPLPAGALAASYNLPSDGFSECGRQGLEDYLSGSRF